MLFHSFEFIFAFLPFAFIIYFTLNRKHLLIASKVWLVVCSFFFYAWWNVLYLPLILASITVNYCLGLLLCNKSKWRPGRKSILTAGILFNILLLGFFKYLDFFIENVNAVFLSNVPLLNLALPLAISFFTFQQIAYLVDSYRARVTEHNFINYALFVSFFPQLIAGPIVHHSEMMPQFSSTRNKKINFENISKGIFFFFIGLFKKVVIADTFSGWATKGFDFSGQLSFVEAWISCLSFAYEIYFDFSGYTDMATGAALLFNIRLPINFNSPYRAHNIQEFWRRWHITLSRFLRDYVYIPLGGNRGTENRTFFNLMVTFLVGGLWHGASWNFVLWGALHGSAMIIYRVWRKTDLKMPAILGWFFTFSFVTVSWVFFRARDLRSALKILSSMIRFDDIVINRNLEQFLPFLKSLGISFGYRFSNVGSNEIKAWLYIIIFSAILFLTQNSNEIMTRFRPDYRRVLFLSLMVITCLSAMFARGYSMKFYYFNF